MSVPGRRLPPTGALGASAYEKQTRRLDNTVATGDPKQPFTCWRNRVNRICPKDQSAPDSAFTLSRMEANHIHRRYGKDRLRGLRRFSLPAPSAREDATLSVGVEALPDFQAAVGRGRQDTAGLWVTTSRGRCPGSGCCLLMSVKDVFPTGPVLICNGTTFPT